jgi:chaperonin GroEL
MSQHFNNTYYEISKGLTFNSGLVHHSFSNQTNGNFSAEKPYIWIIDEVATAINDYVDIIDDKHRQKIPLVIIAKDFSDSFIKYVLTNKIQNGLNTCLLKHPGYGESIREDLKDLKTFLTNGYCNKITVTPYEFTIYNNPDKKRVKTRINHLNSQLEVASTDFDKSTLLRRISNLEQVSAIIYVGGVTLKNAQEEFDRIEDAVGACKSSLKLGVVKGQGTALYEYAQINQDVLPRWFYKTLKAQSYKILENANLQLEPTFEPFNVKTRMMDPTLTDPTDIIVQALLNSFGMSQLIVNSSYIITDN